MIVAGDTVTNAGAAASIVSVIEPALPSLAAVIVTVPGLTAATRPVVETVAVAALLVVHEIGLSVKTEPAASRSVAFT